MNGRGMNLFVGLICLSLMVLSAQDNDVRMNGPHRIQEFHACVGTTAYIPLPLNVISREGHHSTVITLMFQRRHSEKKYEVATFNGKRQLSTRKPFKNRMSISNENSGIFLEGITYDDAGTYIAQARTAKGRVWTRTTNLTVHMRPIIHGHRLNMTQSDVYVKNRRTHCVNITCGTVEYAGYPPVKFVWTTDGEMYDTKTATDDSSSSVQICSPFFGDVTCSIAGFSSVCTYDHVTTLHLDLPGPPANSTNVGQATVTSDLVLIIIMPILAVGIPLIILFVWVMIHLRRSYPQYRERRHFERCGCCIACSSIISCRNHKPHNCMTTGPVLLLQARSTSREPQAEVDVEVDIEVNTEQTHNYDDMSEMDDEQTDIKEEIKDDDEENHIREYEYLNDHHDGDNGQDEAMDNNNINDGGSTKELGMDDEEEDEDEDEEDDSENEDHKVNEERPLMDEPMTSNV